MRLLAKLDRLCNVSSLLDIAFFSIISPEQLAGAGKYIYHRGIPEFEEASDGPKLAALDDLLNEVYSSDVCDLFTKGCHHTNVSVILITRDASAGTSLNAKYLVFKNVRDKNNCA